MEDGIDKLAARLPVLGRVRLYLEQKAAAGDLEAEELLLEVDALFLDQAREEAVAEVVIRTKSGAWIV